MILEVNGQTAIKIKGSIIKHFQNRSTKKRSVLVDCDGDKQWFSAEAVKGNQDGTVLIQEWIYKIKFPNG